MKQINIKNGKCFLRSFMIFLLTLSMIISMLSVCCNAVYSDNNSSVYTIKDHEISEYNKPARIELHFIGDMATKPEFHNSTVNTYKSPLYEFDNMNHEKQTSMILADGGTVEKIENPPNHGDDEFFYGWYVVNIDETTPHETVLYNGTSYDCIVYHQTDDPVLLRYGDVISVEMNDEQTAISWKINGVTVQDDLPLTDKKGCCGHVYLAPLYSDYCFINFFSEPLDNKEPSEIPDETLLTRKLIVPGADNISDVLLSDTIAPSPDSRHKVFVGWESTSESLEYRTKFDMFDSDLKPITGVFRTSDTHIPLREEDDPDGYFLRCHSPKADVNLYPLFSQARWITFDTNSNKEASYVSSEFTFEINFSGKYGYYYSSNKITPSGETKYKILPDEYLRLTMTEYDGKENKGTVNDNQLKKNYPLIDIMIEKFKNSDTDAVSPLLFPDGSIKKHLTWTKYIPGGTVYETGNITFTVTEVEGMEDKEIQF